MSEDSKLRPCIDEKLLREIQKQFSETRGMTVTGVVDWALRYLLKLQTAEYMEKET